MCTSLCRINKWVSPISFDLNPSKCKTGLRKNRTTRLSTNKALAVFFAGFTPGRYFSSFSSFSFRESVSITLSGNLLSDCTTGLIHLNCNSSVICCSVRASMVSLVFKCSAKASSLTCFFSFFSSASKPSTLIIVFS